MKHPSGKLISHDIFLEQHEQEIVALLVELGHTVELIPTARQCRVKTPDAFIDGEPWEFKTARESNTRSLKRLLRRASSQSPNIVLDLRNLPIPPAATEKKARYCLAQVKAIKHLRIIVKPKKVIDIKQLLC